LLVFTGQLLLQMQPVILLVIDPTGYKVESVRTTVQSLGIPHQIKYFAAVIQALSILDAEMELASDLVILNFSLPYMHVTEAIQRLREIRSLIATPMVVMVHDDWEAKQVHQADGVLRLPVTPAGMQEVLELIRADGAATPF
jgi:CheY-like chemotaxis protein